MDRRIFFILFFLPIMFFPAKSAQAGVYDNAYTYYGKYGSESNNLARLNDSDGYIYFCSKGLTSSTSTQYRTVGYTITLNAGGNTDSVEVKLGGTYIKDVSVVKKNGYTYVLRRAKLSLLQSLFNGNSSITWNQIYCNKNTYKFDAIMTVVEKGTLLCGNVKESSNYRKISADNNGYLFRNASGIKNARKWAKPSDLDSFFNKSVAFSPVRYIKTRGAYAEGESGNVFFDGGVHYVRKDSVIRMSFESYFDDTSAVNAAFHPNYNMYNISGWGDNQKYYTKQRAMGAAERSGIIKDGTTSEKPLSILGTVGAVTTSYSDCHEAFRSMARFNFNTPDGGITFVSVEGRVYYDYSYPNNLDNTNNMCNKSEDVGSAFTLMSDASAPQIYLPQYVDEMRDTYIAVTAADSGSGIRSLALCRSDGAIIKQVNYSGRNTLISSVNNFGLPYDKNNNYYIRAVDNVGNVSNSGYIKFSRPVAHVVDAYIAGDYKGYNSTLISTNVYGGNSEIASLTILSENYMNAAMRRVVFVNQSVMAHTMPSGMYRYQYSFNPMYELDGLADGEYKIEVISGGKYVPSNTVTLTLKKDTTKPSFEFRPFYEQNRWFRGTLGINVMAEDNYSGLDKVQVINNGTELKGQISTKYDGYKAYYNIKNEGENNVIIQATDVAGNVNTKKYRFLIDTTMPKSVLAKSFSGLGKANDIWVNREGMHGEIHVSDEASGFTTIKSDYELYRRGDGSATKVKFDDIYNIKAVDSQNVILSFTDKFIESLESSRYEFMVDSSDRAGNWGTVRLYLNVDVDAPKADISCANPWNKTTYKGNLHITDEHSGISSVEVYCGDECEKKVYDINKNEHTIYLDMSSSPNKSKGIYARITDCAGNVTEYPLAEEAEEDNISLKAYVLKYGSDEAPMFFAGEMALMKIEYRGNADYIKVVFPDGLTRYSPDLNRQYDVSGMPTLYVNWGFIIPVKTANGPYHVTVTAYKGDVEYSVYPPFEVYGCVTDRFRTRIR